MSEGFIGKRIGNYLIKEQLGRGGMGIVFKALLLPVEKEVALKIFCPPAGKFSESQEQELKTRFINEGYIMAKINHENIMELSYFDTDNKLCFCVTDATLISLETDGFSKEIIENLKFIKNELVIGKESFIDRLESLIGESLTTKHYLTLLNHCVKEIPYYTMKILPNSLAKLISKRNIEASFEKLSEKYIIDISMQICDALSHLHSKGIIHRDIKPENIIIAPNDVVKVSDFGISEINDMDLNKWGNGFLSLEYCAPEQRNGLKADERSDIYSLGLTIYKLLTGYNTQQKYIQVSELVESVEYLWDDVLSKALKTNPNDRFQSADEFKQALHKLQNSEKSIYEQMVEIPKGSFLFGKNKGERHLPAYYIDIYPVTNCDYRKFIESEKYAEPAYWHDPKFNKDDQPVVGVSWEDANAYAAWAQKCLPTVEEWEKAARGTDGKKFPWGKNFPNKENCNFDENIGHTTPVNKYKKNKSPYGCYDFAGNVWEWTCDAKENDAAHKIVKGGSWVSLPMQLQIDTNNYIQSDVKKNSIGFRCVIRNK